MKLVVRKVEIKIDMRKIKILIKFKRKICLKNLLNFKISVL